MIALIMSLFGTVEAPEKQETTQFDFKEETQNFTGSTALDSFDSVNAWVKKNINHENTCSTCNHFQWRASGDPSDWCYGRPLEFDGHKMKVARNTTRDLSCENHSKMEY